MIITAIDNSNNQVITFTLTADEMAARDERIITAAITKYISATTALPDAAETVNRTEAAKLLKVTPNYVHQYCTKHGITWADRAEGEHYRYHKLSIVNHLKK